MTSDPFNDTELGVPRNYLRACLLLLLAEQPSHGYELWLNLPTLGADPGTAHTGVPYRTLRQLEEEGLVVSHWDRSDAGPARRVYAVTADGMEWLHLAATSIRTVRRGMSRFLDLYRQLTDGS